MFNNCSNLINVGNISTTVAGNNAYEKMFVKNCLTEVGNITAKSAGIQSYYHMFYNPINIVRNYGDMTANGLTVGNIEVSEIVSEESFCRMFYDYDRLISVRDITIPLTDNKKICQHMFEDCINLQSVGHLTHGTVPSSTFLHMFEGCSKLSTVGNITCTGSVLNEETYFEIGSANNTSLKSVGKIEAEQLSKNVYESMFQGCIALSNVGSIVSKKLADFCYESMFQGCISLETIDLTGMGKFEEEIIYSCQGMFEDCSSLSTIIIGFNKWHETATDNWVKNVASTGVMSVVGEVDDEFLKFKGSSYIPENWTVVSVD